jgi:SAM-dependent methyltransferase
MGFIWKDKFNKYIKLQRNHKIFTNEMLEQLIRKQQEEIKIINSYIKEKPQSILDIGCGLGIYDLALQDFYKTNIKYYLLDKTTTPSEEKNVYYGHREKGAFYNNMDYTKDFLVTNGISENNIECIMVNDNNDVTNNYLREKLSNIDLVISIISWGFHYPIKTYLDTVHQILNANGLLCLHCRNINENLPILMSKFEILYPTMNSIKEGSFLICKKN